MGTGPQKSRTHWLTALDLFCGSGAVTAALKRKHFKVVAAVDNDPVACSTFKLNHPTTSLIERDIRKIDPRDIRARLLDGRNLDLLVVCAPCQPFSSQNRHRRKDSRARLILEAGRFAKELRPKLIFFENVPGLASHVELIEELKEALGDKYHLGEPQRVDAADYGVPQRRIRCIMLATRGKEPPKLPQPATPLDKRVTVRDAIGHLRKLKSGGQDPRDELHFARNHQDIALKRLAAIPKNGGSRIALPKRLRLPCHDEIDDKKFSDVYGRMNWNEVAPTLTTGCTDITRGRFAHPRDNRAISLREAALLQTFPEQYQFTGTASEIAKQIGNAVPMKLIDALAPMFRTALKGNAH